MLQNGLIIDLICHDLVYRNNKEWNDVIGQRESNIQMSCIIMRFDVKEQPQGKLVPVLLTLCLQKTASLSLSQNVACDFTQKLESINSFVLETFMCCHLMLN